MDKHAAYMNACTSILKSTNEHTRANLQLLCKLLPLLLQLTRHRSACSLMSPAICIMLVSSSTSNLPSCVSLVATATLPLLLKLLGKHGCAGTCTSVTLSNTSREPAAAQNGSKLIT
jgi:hypothetical protein